MAILNLDYNVLWESICNWSRKAGRAATRLELNYVCEYYSKEVDNSGE